MRSLPLLLSCVCRVSGFSSALRTISYHTSTALGLNRFLFTQNELDVLGEDIPVVSLPKDDYRTQHAAKILGVQNGETIRAGVVSCDNHDGLITDNAKIEWIPEGKVKKAEPLGNGNPPGSLRVILQDLQEPPTSLDTSAVSLILALPRPLQLGRMLPMISQMGVDKLILTQAKKVPKDYFGSHLFRKPDLLTEKLVEGLCQAGDVRLPEVHIVRNLEHFLSEELDSLFPQSDYARVIAHPQRDFETANMRMRQVSLPDGPEKKLVIAVGPEGGWEEPDEIEKFLSHEFQQITMGSRILRSDCAVVSLLSLAHDACVN